MFQDGGGERSTKGETVVEAAKMNKYSGNLGIEEGYSKEKFKDARGKEDR